MTWKNDFVDVLERNVVIDFKDFGKYWNKKIEQMFEFNFNRFSQVILKKQYFFYVLLSEFLAKSVPIESQY